MEQIALTKAEKDLWVQKLRSGEYEQGKGTLRSRNNKYCCLGVLAECREVAWQGPSYSGDFYFLEKIKDYITTWSTCLPDAWLRNDEVQNILMSMNDSKKLTFNQIADWIEANVKTLD